MTDAACSLRSLTAAVTMLGSFAVSFGQEDKPVPSWAVFPGDDWETITPAGGACPRP